MKPKKIPKEDFDYIYSKVPRLCVDLIVLIKQGIVLTKRLIPPYKGMWHIPGGTVLYGETLEEAVNRVADEELGVKVIIEKNLGFVEYINYPGNGHVITTEYQVKALSDKMRGSFQGMEIKVFKKLLRFK